MVDRQAALDRIDGGECDVLVVGGGITGAAVAHLAAARGLRVVLVDKGDFASGTSSRSSRLIHGGLRYLQHGQIGVVYHSLREQLRLSRAAPHLVRRQSFLIPVYADSPLPSLAIQALLGLYHVLRPRASGLSYARLGPRATLEQESLLRSAGLRGGLLYHEFSTHDARLVVETVLAASVAGAVAVNYVGLLDFRARGGRVAGGVLQDQLTGRVLETRARAVVNAAGPWSDRLAQILDPTRHRLRLSKGVHIILPHRRLPLRRGVNLFSPRDGRAFMARPAGNLVFVGPTETEYAGDPETVVAEAADRDYLLETVRAYFPGAGLGPADVVAMTAGLRPLYDRPARVVGEVSRAYEIVWGPEGLLSVLGGKLTLHRRAADAAVRFLERRWGARPAANGPAPLPLPGACWTEPPEQVAARLQAAGLLPTSITHVLQTYGARSVDLLTVMRDEPEGGRPVVFDLPHIWSELVFAREQEMAVYPNDYIYRRSDLGLMAAAEGRTVPHLVASRWNLPVGPLAVHSSP